MEETQLLKSLWDERSIYRALCEIARAMDERDWATLSASLATDAEAEFGTGRVRGSDAIVETIRVYLDNCGATQHLLGNVVVDIEGDYAQSRAYVRDVHLNAVGDPETRFYTLGEYRDSWRRGTDGSWQLTERIKSNRAYAGTLEVFAPADGTA
ncbi:nuclear transport factor 2 family protein [Microbacterium sp. NPDC056044]|uniref:nuclear transport factor 2 family protein n=1 Tax=Microbacterium sp. NPDC056044 TaxID=3345690 RepID=UPI0035DFAA7F